MSEYDSDYIGDSEDGRHFYGWFFEELNIAFRVYSAGPEHIIVGYYFPFENSKKPWVGVIQNNLLFDRE